MNYTTLAISRIGKAKNIAHVQFNRPNKGNAMNNAFFKEFTDFFNQLAKDTSYRAAVVSAHGKYFTVGLDLKEATFFDGDKKEEKKDFARKTYEWYNNLQDIQEVVTCMERCPQPVIFCMHSYVLGGGINLACGADIRLCAEDAKFSVKEIDIGIAADLGALQRIEKVFGSASLVRDLCFTGRNLLADEAKSSGFVSGVFKTKEECVEKGIEMAEMIASKSPVAVAGTKKVLNFSRDHSVETSLQFQSAWNAAMNQTEDVKKAAMASLTKSEQPEYSKL